MASLPVIAGQELDEGLEEMWLGSAQGIQVIDAATENWRNSKLPLAKIKKIMKSEDVILQELERDRQEKLAAEEGQTAAPTNEKSTKFMISGEAPVLMSKACELMIKDLSFRAWRHTERNRRRTLQKQDLHAAVGESEVYDFLIDIVPRVTTTTPKIQHTQHIPASASMPANAMMPPTLSVGMQVAGMPVGIPAALAGQTAQSGTMMDHSNAGMMQLMGTAQHHQAQPQTHHLNQHQAPGQFHQDPSQQIVVGAPQQAMPPGMHPQIVQQNQHMQQFAGIAQLPAGQPIPAGAPGAYDPNLVAMAPGPPSNAPATTASQGGASQWSSGT
mmetsp:Transcript_5397/g.11139  ORF Transcript_5397/g.11139 Transcript_5397/m.11139 type:complete len:329 (+) Transcript_5397:276-1262(+)|eukprot:CAMPEP_0197267604 /NCGR_PEP_ID=MMETSP1432-20130617/3682_1 /TAXON_ID=44447 /ORGANISM="Pseudo-nitzschia delicatissima, Strain UNC1205" /LENGTH=328 /DNA_ID=CAMNT_0042732571 /DNA_START=237 /DNA_END=1223 /DNA_ORIENTATION=-